MNSHINKVNWPKVDVIIPSIWNRMDFFPKTLESIKNQTYENLNIVIIGDETWMNNLEWNIQSEFEWFIHREMVSDWRIQYHRNTGRIWAAATRNIWIKNNKSPLVAFADDDDLQHKQKIKTQVEHMLDWNIWVVGTWWYVIDEFDNIKSVIKSKNQLNLDIRKCVVYSNPFIMSSTMVRRELWDNINWFDEDNIGSEDYQLRSDIMLSSNEKNFINIPELYVLYRSYAWNISHEQRQLQAINSLKTSLNHIYRVQNKLKIITPKTIKKIIRKTLFTVLSIEQRKKIKWFRDILRKIPASEDLINVDFSEFWL